MAGFSQTYAQIRNYATGSGCKNNDRLDFFMVSCLQEIWTKVCDDPYYFEELALDVAEGVSKVDISQCATITSIKVRYEIDEVAYCRELGSPTSIPERSCKCPSTSVADVECEHVESGVPNEFEIVGGMLCLNPVPDTDMVLDIECFREVDCTLFELSDDDPPVIMWNTVDLPVEYHGIFANLVLSKSFADNGDYAAATYWEQKASTGLDSLVAKAENQFDADAAVSTDCNPMAFKMIRRGDLRGCNKCGDDCCCEPEMQQILVEKVYVDCDGLPIEEPVAEESERKFAVARPEARVGRHG